MFLTSRASQTGSARRFLRHMLHIEKAEHRMGYQPVLRAQPMC